MKEEPNRWRRVWICGHGVFGGEEHLKLYLQSTWGMLIRFLLKGQMLVGLHPCTVFPGFMFDKMLIKVFSFEKPDFWKKKGNQRCFLGEYVLNRVNNRQIRHLNHYQQGSLHVWDRILRNCRLDLYLRLCNFIDSGFINSMSTFLWYMTCFIEKHMQ